MSKASNLRRLVSPEVAAEIVGVSLTTFDEHVKPALPKVKIGRRVGFDLRDLDAWIAKHKLPPPSTSAVPQARRARPRAARSRVPTIALSPRAQAIRDKFLAKQGVEPIAGDSDDAASDPQHPQTSET